jgi:hypothetical protein
MYRKSHWHDRSAPLGLSQRRGDLRIAERRTLVGLCLMLTMALSGCATTAQFDPAPSHSSPAPRASTAAVARHSPVDPLSEITDPTAGRYLPSDIEIALHVQGLGPRQFNIPRPTTGTKSLQFYVSCEPETSFKVTMSNFYSGGCSDHYANTGTIPLPSGDQPLHIELDIASGVQFWLLAIAIP